MNPGHEDTHGQVRVRVPADIEAPDTLAYGLTFRQLAILSVAAAALYGAWTGLHSLVPTPVLLGAATVFGGIAIGLALGRRDGLPLDRWLAAALRHALAPKALSTCASAAAELPDWVQAPRQAVFPAPLRLPLNSIDTSGEITLPRGQAAIVAATGVNLQLRTPEEQAGLIDAYGRWLNSLSGPTQIVVSAQPVDLASHAERLRGDAASMPHPALEAACVDHAAFLEDLADRRDPLRRQVLITTRAAAAPGDHPARRRAEQTVRALSGLGVAAKALDRAAATATLAAAADPYRAARPGGLAAPGAVITARAKRHHARRRDR